VIRRTFVAFFLAAGLSGAPALAEGVPPVPAAQMPAPKSQAASPTKPKPRRVIIFGTTIVGDVLKPPIDRTVPWQRPAAFQSTAAPLAHDFMSELLTPLDRDAILQDEGEHPH
jgi:hypothetical protein